MVSGPSSTGCAAAEPVKATTAGDFGPQDSQNGQHQQHGVGDTIEILMEIGACQNGQQLIVIGEDSDLLKLEGDRTVPKAYELQVWKWVAEPEAELDRQNSNLDMNNQDHVSPIAKKLNRAISFRDEDEIETVNEDDHWREVEDVLMKALLKHWGDGSFQPAQQGHISAKRDLENSLRGALAAELKKCKPQHKLSRQETSVLFAAWTESLYGGIHDGKPMVSLGEATMCLRNMTMVW